MKLIHDCIRDVMLYAEEYIVDFNGVKDVDIQKKYSKYSIDDIYYTCVKLSEAGYLKIQQYIDGSLSIEDITYNGHLFLDNIRDNKVWSTTKGILSKFSSTSISIVENVASQVITNLVLAAIAKSSIE